MSPGGVEGESAVRVRRARVLRVGAICLSAFPVLAGVALTTIAGPGELAAPLAMAAIVVLAFVSHLVCDIVGYRLHPLDPSLAPDVRDDRALAELQSSTARRAATAVPVLLIGLIIAVTAQPPSSQGLLLSSTMASALLVVHVVPHRRVVTRSEAALNAGGASTRLVAYFPVPETPSTSRHTTTSTTVRPAATAATSKPATGRQGGRSTSVTRAP